MVSRSWLDTFQNAKLSNPEVTTSDHTPILLGSHIQRQVVEVKRFKFENAWLRDPMSKNIVKESWERHKGHAWNVKIKECSIMLAVWGNEINGSFGKRIARSKKIIRTLKGRRDAYSVNRYKKENKNLTEILTQQEVFWKQHSKQLWLKEGDQNNKFFHAAAETRRRTNLIKNLVNDEGIEVDWESGMQDTMINYF